MDILYNIGIVLLSALFLFAIQGLGVFVLLNVIGFWDQKENAKQSDIGANYQPTVDNTTTPPTDNDPLRILREDTYTNDEINCQVGEMHRRQYAESQK